MHFRNTRQFERIEIVLTATGRLESSRMSGPRRSAVSAMRFERRRNAGPRVSAVPKLKVDLQSFIGLTLTYNLRFAIIHFRLA
jgi:hypothetical protein